MPGQTCLSGTAGVLKELWVDRITAGPDVREQWWDRMNKDHHSWRYKAWTFGNKHSFRGRPNLFIAAPSFSDNASIHAWLWRRSPSSQRQSFCCSCSWSSPEQYTESCDRFTALLRFLTQDDWVYKVKTFGTKQHNNHTDKFIYQFHPL